MLHFENWNLDRIKNNSLLDPFQDLQMRQSTAYSLHQPQGNKEHGTERTGNLYKKSDGCVDGVATGEGCAQGCVCVDGAVRGSGCVCTHRPHL